MPSSEEIYRQLVGAVKRGELPEPFSKADFQRACPGLSDATYRAFLWRHSGGNAKSKDSPLLERVAPTGFRLSRPFKYGL
jgi:hypothetical protein